MVNIPEKYKTVLGFFLVFFAVFSFYVLCLPRELAAYRDAGEMAMDIWSMSISHQPGYPLYNIMARSWVSIFRFGDTAFSLNLFSAFFGALSCSFIYLAASFAAGRTVSAMLALLFSLNFTVQTFSSVSEMYSLNLFFASVLFFMSFRYVYGMEAGERNFLLFAYLCGLFLGNRTDLLLLYPAFLLAAWGRLKNSRSPLRLLISGFLFSVLGLSVYFYLPARSHSMPLINWSDPSKLENFINVITRKSYGSTLDLISLNYAPGELFLPNLYEYSMHVLRNFNLAILLCAAGIIYTLRKDRKVFFFLGIAFLFTGPVFLYLANMPPNPHAMSIVEPYYAAPDLILIFFAAYGAVRISSVKRLLPSALILASIIVTLAFNFPRSYRAGLNITRSYSKDVFSSLPEKSIVVARKDVQLFTLWYYAYARNMRPDLAVIGQGLSGAFWYEASPIVASRLEKLPHLSSQKEGWLALKKLSGKRIFATLDCELPDDLPKKPLGLFYEILPDRNAGEDIRAVENYSFSAFSKPYNDFFVSDLASAYAQSIVAVFSSSIFPGKSSYFSDKMLDLAASLDEDLPDPFLFKGFYLSSKGDWKSALYNFEKACEKYCRLIDKARWYRSLPDITGSLNISASQALLNLGVAYEKNGRLKESEQTYLKALSINPNLAQAHFNLAVLYWDRDRARARTELYETLRIDPSHQQARYYLRVLEKN